MVIGKDAALYRETAVMQGKAGAAARLIYCRKSAIPARRTGWIPGVKGFGTKTAEQRRRGEAGNRRNYAISGTITTR